MVPPGLNMYRNFDSQFYRKEVEGPRKRGDPTVTLAAHNLLCKPQKRRGASGFKQRSTFERAVS